MRKGLHIIGVMVLGLVLCAGAQNPGKRYTVAFYNLENLFDTIKSPGVNDEEFTPEGAKNWNSQKYGKKMSNIEEVFYKLSADTRAYPAVIGVSEIENRNVLEDIVALPKLQKANYQIVHYDSPDKRGVDVALLYRPSQFRLEGSAALPVKLADNPDWKTRDVLMVWGTIEDEPFYFFVNHWPSRLGGQQQSEYLRELAAGVVRHAVDSVVAARPDAKIVIMGDLNDDPTDRSIAVTLGARAKMSEAKGAADLFNPVQRNAPQRVRNAGLPGCHESVRQHDRQRKSGDRRLGQAEALQTRHQPLLWKHLRPSVPASAERPVQELSVAHVRRE